MDRSWRAKECSPIPSQVIATCFALVSFAAALVLGMIAGNHVGTVLWRAIILMLVAWFIGRFIGFVAQRTIDDQIAQYKGQNPIDSDSLDRSGQTFNSQPEDTEIQPSERSSAVSDVA